MTFAWKCCKCIYCFLKLSEINVYADIIILLLSVFKCVTVLKCQIRFNTINTLRLLPHKTRITPRTRSRKFEELNILQLLKISPLSLSEETGREHNKNRTRLAISSETWSWSPSSGASSNVRNEMKSYLVSSIHRTLKNIVIEVAETTYTNCKNPLLKFILVHWMMCIVVCIMFATPKF